MAISRSKIVKLFTDVGAERRTVNALADAAAAHAVELGAHPDLSAAEADHQYLVNLTRYLAAAEEQLRAAIQTIDYRAKQDEAAKAAAKEAVEKRKAGAPS